MQSKKKNDPIKKCKIAYKTYTIKSSKNPRYQGVDVNGLYNSNNNNIYIRSSLNQEDRVQVILHELVHVIDEIFQIGLNETKTDKVAQGFATLFTDNPELMIDLVNKTIDLGDEEVNASLIKKASSLKFVDNGDQT